MLAPSGPGTQEQFFKSPEFLDFSGFYEDNSSPTHVLLDFQTMNSADGAAFSNNDKKRTSDDITRLETTTMPLKVNAEESDDDEGDPDLKRKKRVLANRRSARESYLRRKNLFSELENSVSILSENNAELVDENKKLREKVMDLQEQLRLSCMPTAGMPNTMGVPGMERTSCVALEQPAGRPLPLASATSQPSQQLHRRQQSSPLTGQELIQQQQGELDQLLELLIRGRHM